MKKNQKGSKPTTPSKKSPTTPAETTGQDAETTVSSPAVTSDSPVSTNPTGAQPMADITFTRNTAARKSLAEVYTAEGYPGSVRFSKTLFVNKTAPDSITISNPAFAGPRVKETKEERKARLKAMPKLTDAQKLEKIEAKAAKLRAKVQGTAAA